MTDMKEKGYTHTHTHTTQNFSVSASRCDCVYSIPKRERCSRVSYFFHSNTIALCPWVPKQKKWIMQRACCRPTKSFQLLSFVILFRFLYFLTKVKPGHSMPWQNHGLVLLMLLLPNPKGSAAAWTLSKVSTLQMCICRISKTKEKKKFLLPLWPSPFFLYCWKLNSSPFVIYILAFASSIHNKQNKLRPLTVSLIINNSLRCSCPPRNTVYSRRVDCQVITLDLIFFLDRSPSINFHVFITSTQTHKYFI